MKNYRETYIRQAEIAQLIILNHLYQQRGSRDLIFQGGTAIRWCYGGNRFSEDLDFVTPLPIEKVWPVLESALKGIERVMISHFGTGAFNAAEKQSRASSFKCFLNFHPESSREKISVKFEVEGLVSKQLPEGKKHILSGLPPVAYLIADGSFRVPRPNAIVVAETTEEILSDKVRSLLERPYLKGRDLFDIWYLRTVLNTAVNIEFMERKFKMYREPFIARRSMDFFAQLTNESNSSMTMAISQDLSRFLPPDVFEVQRKHSFDAYINAVQSLFEELREKGVRLP
jgi:predicted nucleotidyltransferase component of viral defense system